MLWRVEVIADNSGKWCGNGLTFATRGEAEAYALDLACRWTSVRDWRVVEVEEPKEGRS
jgi:hypothetical protein